MDDQNERLLSPADVERVLARAVELEVMRDNISEKELLDIASEAGIHPDAVRAALQERRNAVPTQTRFRNTWQPTWLSSGVAAVALGFATRVVRPYVNGSVHWEALGALAITAAALTWLAWRPANKRPHLRFQVHNVLIWTGYAAGWSLRHGSIWEDLVGVTIASAVVAAAIGAVITSLRTPPAAGASVGAAEGKQRAVDRVRQWFKRSRSTGVNTVRFRVAERTPYDAARMLR